MPQRTSKRQKKPPERCAAPNCGANSEPGKDFCVLHGVLYQSVEALRNSGQRAVRRGDYTGGTLRSIGAVLVDFIGQSLSTSPAQTIIEEFVKTKAQAFYPQSVVDPWKVLGLDRTKATSTSVRTMQKKLAKIYHSDTGTDSEAEEKMKEINAAAAACLKELNGR